MSAVGFAGDCAYCEGKGRYGYLQNWLDVVSRLRSDGIPQKAAMIEESWEKRAVQHPWVLVFVDMNELCVQSNGIEVQHANITSLTDASIKSASALHPTGSWTNCPVPTLLVHPPVHTSSANACLSLSSSVIVSSMLSTHARSSQSSCND